MWHLVRVSNPRWLLFFTSDTVALHCDDFVMRFWLLIWDVVPINYHMCSVVNVTDIETAAMFTCSYLRHSSCCANKWSCVVPLNDWYSVCICPQFCYASKQSILVKMTHLETRCFLSLWSNVLLFFSILSSVGSLPYSAILLHRKLLLKTCALCFCMFISVWISMCFFPTMDIE